MTIRKLKRQIALLEMQREARGSLSREEGIRLHELLAERDRRRDEIELADAFDELKHALLPGRIEVYLDRIERALRKL